MGKETPSLLHRGLLRLYPAAFRRLHGYQILAFWTTRPTAAAVPTVLGRFDLLRQDLRYARRSLLRQPLFTIVAIATLAVGIGSTTAVFSIVDTVLFRPLPYADPAGLVQLGRLSEANGIGSLALPEAQALARLSAFENVATGMHYGVDVQWDESAEVLNGASVGYQLFDVLGVQPILGRVYSAEEDVPGGPPVILISARIWRRQFAAAPDVIGSTMALIRRRSLAEEPIGEYYRPHAQMSWPSMALMVATTGANPNLATDLRRTIAEIDSMVPISDVHTLQQNVDASVSEPRFRLLLVGGFAVVACLLAMLGVYAVMALTVSRRTHDIGIRMALGAGRATVRRQVVVEGMRLAVAGVTIGLVVALGASRLIGAMLYDVEPTDPLTFTGVLVLTLVVAAVACYLPARRASRLDPLAALRSD